MKTPKDIIDQYIIERKISNGRTEGEIKVTEGYLNNDIKAMMKEYAVEAINELVDQYLEYPPKQSKDIVQIANRIKRGIHGITIERKDDKSSPIDTWDISYMSDRERKRKTE